jgi:hypothetical protein
MSRAKNKVVTGQPLERALDAARADGRKALESETDAKVAQLRADALALSRAADVLADASLISNLGAGEACATLRTLAAGIHFAENRMTRSDDCPF